MKKFLFFVVVVFVCVVANAQTFSPVAKVAKEKSSFVAYGVDGSSVGITAAQYLELKKNVSGYDVVSYKANGAVSGFSGVVSRKEYTRELFTVDSVSVQSDGVMVMFANGKSYRAKSFLWADVLNGQKVVHTVIKSSLRNFEKYEALESAPVDFVENHGLQTTTTVAKNNPLAKVTADLKTAFGYAKEKVEAKVDAFIEPKTEPKANAYSLGGLKLIEE